MDNEILERLKNIKNANGLNVNTFAARLGEKPNKVTKVLNGHQEVSLTFLQNVTSAFRDVSMDWLVSGEGPTPITYLEHILRKDGVGDFDSKLEEYPIGDDSYDFGYTVVRDEKGVVRRTINENEATEVTKEVNKNLKIDNAEFVDFPMRQVPLLSAVQAGAWTEMQDLSYDDIEYVPCSAKSSEKTFAMRVKGESMIPTFVEGEIVHVDPCAQWDNGSYVVAKLDDENEVTLKQLIIDGNKKFLKAVNPDYPVRFLPINGNCTIIGKVISSMRYF